MTPTTAGTAGFAPVVPSTLIEQPVGCRVLLTVFPGGQLR